MGLILPGDDVFSIAERVQHGDPIVGWRGDPTMDVYLFNGWVEVWGFDKRGERYRVLRLPCTTGWQHEVLARLRDGDWQRGTQQLASEFKTVVDTERRDTVLRWAESRAEHVDKVKWISRKVQGVD